MLVIENLHVEVEGREVLKGLNMQINLGEVHVVMGPNGAGKSTLSHIIAGKGGYNITGGSIVFDGKDLLAMDITERANSGLFLAFQYPVEIPGVSMMSFLKMSYEALCKVKGEKPLEAAKFLKLVQEKAAVLSMNTQLLKRSVNSGFSGGEKKLCEALQMLLLDPRIAILDETDSGLDVDALRSVMKVVNLLKNERRSWLIITHYQSLLNHIEPDCIHILCDGRIKHSGGKELVSQLEENGFGGLCC